MRRGTGLSIVAGISALLLTACGGAAAPGGGGGGSQAQPTPEYKQVEQVGEGFKVPKSIPDITGFPLYLAPDDKEKDVKNYKRGGTFNFVSLDPPHLDIGLTGSCTLYSTNDMVYNKLVRGKVGPNAHPFRVEIEGDLAKSWEVSKDGLTYTFKLNQGVKWQNLPPVGGRELVADDVKFSFEEYKNGIQAATFENVAKIETPDKYTVVITLKEANTDFPASIAAMSFIRPPEVKKEFGSYREKAIGTGPFILDKWTPKQGENYSRNPDYWEKDSAGNPLPYVDKANKFIISDTSAHRAAYRAKQVDIVTNSTLSLAQELKQSDPDTQFMSNSTGLFRGNVNGMLLRMDRKPFDDIRVRRALSMALDRPTITDTLYGGYYAMSMGTSWTWWADDAPTLKDWGPYYQYNIAEAKKLLADAGYPNGITIEMKDWYLRTQADTIIAMAAEAGIKIKRQEVDNPTQVTILTKGEYGDMTAAAWYIPSYDADSESYPYLHSKGPKNYGLYKDAEMDKLLEAQRKETDPAKRKDIFKKIFERQADQLPLIWIPSSRTTYSWRGYVKNFRPHGIMGDTSCYTTGNISRVVWLDK